jgi:hypothetical protein
MRRVMSGVACPKGLLILTMSTPSEINAPELVRLDGIARELDAIERIGAGCALATFHYIIIFDRILASPIAAAHVASDRAYRRGNCPARV